MAPPRPNRTTLNYGDLDQLGGAPPPQQSPFGPAVIDLSNARAPQPIAPDADGVVKIDHADGAVTIELNPSSINPTDKPDSDNLAEQMSEDELSRIAAEILDGVEQDEQSRKDWLETRAKAIRMLALKIDEPRGDMGTSAAPLEGMSTVRHPLLLQAAVAFQAGARAELLPADGPAKVRNDMPPGAPQAPPPAPGQPPQPHPDQGSAPLDEMANLLESKFNHYLTSVDKEYVADTDRMFFNVAWGGDGFKKIYHCPLKRRPISRSVDPEDLIVSDSEIDLHSCPRITQRIRMSRATLRRMQIVGAYRDIDIPRDPSPFIVDVVTKERADITGQSPQPARPKDMPYTIYESYVELDLDEFAPKQFKGEALPLPYRVAIEKDSRKILAIHRDWDEKDELCNRRRTFVQFPFIRGIGFYGIGFVHLIGQIVVALTAGWRLALDSGMFGNFSGFAYAKQAGRQLTNQFRCPPGGGIGLDVPGNMSIKDVLMPFPYKEMGPAFPAWLNHVEELGKQVAMVANSNVSEGTQNAPVGTTLALIEQNSKVVASAFKRLHAAQAEEFAALKDLFAEDPDAMFRDEKAGQQTPQWQRDKFQTAIQQYDLVPVADPNNPTSLHRSGKAAVLKMLQKDNPQIYNAMAIDRRVLSLSNIDPEGIFMPPLSQDQQLQQAMRNPQVMLAQAKLQLQQQQINIKQKQLQIQAAEAAMKQQGIAADRASDQQIAQAELDLKREQLQADMMELRIKQLDTEMSHVTALSGGSSSHPPRPGAGHAPPMRQGAP
jgi:hypothetical protein